jgi:hypothetical protein
MPIDRDFTRLTRIAHVRCERFNISIDEVKWTLRMALSMSQSGGQRKWSKRLLPEGVGRRSSGGIAPQGAVQSSIAAALRAEAGGRSNRESAFDAYPSTR